MFAEKKQQRLHIGNIIDFNPRISLLTQSSLVEGPVLFYDFKENDAFLYPPDTNAFLYYSVSPGKPRIAGELRLRVTSSDDPASFESGSDLLRRDGQPWSRPLFTLPRKFLPLYEKLREDRLVPDDLDAVLSTLPSKSIHHRSNVLYTLNDTFIVKFGGRGSTLHFITEQGVESLFFDRPFSEGRRIYTSGPKFVYPYTGAYKNHNPY
jgi:hypothetical protein